MRPSTLPRALRLVAASALVALAVAACSRKEEARPEAPAAAPPPPAAEAPPAPPPPPPPKPKHPAAVVKDTPLAADAQMQEDAAAVGMTSARRDSNTTGSDAGADEGSPAGNTTN